MSDTSASRMSLAIVGLGFRLPEADTIEELWDLLEQGKSTVSEIPALRFNLQDYQKAGEQRKSRLLHTRYGNFLKAADGLDAGFFKVSPREALSMSPQQRVLLTVAHEALEDSGYVPHSTPSSDPSRFGCYVGAATNDYVFNLRNDIDVYYSTGTLAAFLSGRLSYVLGLGGPSITIDTACSSSLVAVHQACRALLADDCDVALAGGVNVISSPDMYLGLDRAHFLSPTGQCRPFDANADGYCRAEGAVIFVIKRLTDAVESRDRIYGVIRGTEVNQSFAQRSITRPDQGAQSALFRSLLNKAAVDTQAVTVIEAHGTGTQVGDPIEIASISDVFGEDREQKLFVSSIKGNVGHSEAASGCSSLLKVLLMIHHGKIFRQASFERLNPNLADMFNRHFVIPTRTEEWSSRPRLGLVNNFGAAGSNAALLIQEYVEKDGGCPASVDSRTLEMVFGLSASSTRALEELRSRYLGLLDQPRVSMADIAYTSTSRRAVRSHRIAFSCSSPADARQKLARAPVRVVSDSQPAQIIFIFSGQGSQYPGMGQDLYRHCSSFRKVVDSCDAWLRDHDFLGVIPVILANDDESIKLTISEKIQAFQSSIFVIEYALYVLLQKWGLRPDAVGGHSLGEYAALVAAGVMSMETGLALVAFRSRLMTQCCDVAATGMLAVKSSASRIQPYMQPGRFSVACDNGSDSVVVAGAKSELDNLKSELSDNGVKSLFLDVPFGYHSNAMQPIVNQLTNHARNLTYNHPRLPIMSNVTGRLIIPGETDSPFNADYFSAHCTKPVLFRQGLEDLCANLAPSDALRSCNPLLWMEIGPHPSLTSSLRANTPGGTAEHTFLSTLVRNTSAHRSLSTTLEELYLNHTSLNWCLVFEDLWPDGRCTRLPKHPLYESSYWVPYKEFFTCDSSTADASKPSLRYQLIQRVKTLERDSEGVNAVFESDVQSLRELISGHQVGGVALCPASVYHELVVAGTKTALDESGQMSGDLVVAKDVIYPHAFVLTASSPEIMVTQLSLHHKEGKISGTFSISTASTVHCSGNLELKPEDDEFEVAARKVEHRRRSHISHETYASRSIYDVIFPRVVQYSTLYHSIRSLSLDESGLEAFAIVGITERFCDHNRFAASPILVDTMLHLAGFMANRLINAGQVFICESVGKMKHKSFIDDKDFNLYGTIVIMEDGRAIATVFAQQNGRVVAQMKRIRFRLLQLDRLVRVLSSKQFADEREVASVSVQKHNRHPASLKATSHESKSEAVDEKLSTIRKIVASVSGSDNCNIHDDTNLSDLGVDSMMAIEISSALKLAFPNASIRTVSLRDSLKDLANSIARETEPSSPITSSTSTLCNASDKVQQDVNVANLMDMLSRLSGVPVYTLRSDSRLSDAGFDSLMIMELVSELQHLYPVHHISSSSLHPDMQVTAVVEMIERKHDRRTHSQSSCKLLHYNSDSGPTLVLIHDGSGLTEKYAQLSPIQGVHELWGLASPYLGALETFASVVSLAREYVRELEHNLNTTDLILGGWSFGGVLAFEITNQMLERGHHIKGLVLIDAPPPTSSEPLPDKVIKSVSQSSSIVAHMLASTKALVAYSPSKDQNLAIPAVLLNASTPSEEPALRLCGDTSHWSQSVKVEKVILTPGDHFHIFDPDNISTVSRALGDAVTCILGHQ